MRVVLAAIAILATAFTALAAKAPATGAKLEIKKEIVNICGNFPYGPTIAMDAKTATLDDLKRARAAVENYIDEVSHYQKCLLAMTDALGPKMTQKDADYIVFVFNRAQEEREVLSIDFNKLVDAYNLAHGIKPKPEKPSKTAKSTAPATATTGTAPTPPKPAKPAKPAATTTTSTTGN